MRIARSSLILCLVSVCSVAYAGNDAHLTRSGLFPDGVNSNQIGVLLSFDRTDDEGRPEYIQGMPVILDVRVVNLPAKRKNTEAKRIRIAREWGKALKFSLRTAEGLPVEAPFHRIQQEEQSGDTIELFESDLRGEWILAANMTKELVPGRYTLTVSLGPVRCESSFVIAEGQTKHESMIAVRKAWASYREKKYSEAIDLARLAMNKHGKLTRDGKNYAIIIMAQSQEKLGYDQEALRLFEEFIGCYVPQNPRQECDLVKLKIAELKTRLQQHKP